MLFIVYLVPHLSCEGNGYLHLPEGGRMEWIGLHLLHSMPGDGQLLSQSARALGYGDLFTDRTSKFIIIKIMCFFFKNQTPSVQYSTQVLGSQDQAGPNTGTRDQPHQFLSAHAFR